MMDSVNKFGLDKYRQLVKKIDFSEIGYSARVIFKGG